MRNITIARAVVIFASLLQIAPFVRAGAAPQKKEYLSEVEADKIRDAGTSGPRIVLFVKFAADRIKKLQYEFAHFDPADEKRTERLNGLINSYTGCVDDASELLDIGIQRQEDIRAGVKALRMGLKDFLPYLQNLSANGVERETYKVNLDDAIEATEDASKLVEHAAKEMSPPPVRRKPS